MWMWGWRGVRRDSNFWMLVKMTMGRMRSREGRGRRWRVDFNFNFAFGKLLFLGLFDFRGSLCFVSGSLFGNRGGNIDISVELAG